jgi:hypothetical protein
MLKEYSTFICETSHILTLKNMASLRDLEVISVKFNAVIICAGGDYIQKCATNLYRSISLPMELVCHSVIYATITYEY